MVIELIQPKMELRPMDTELKVHMAPSLALLTVAGMIPQEHTAVIVNENVERIDFDRYADLVGVTVTVDTLPRAAKIAEEFRKRSVRVIARGTHITSSPETAAEYFDSLCVGMAERKSPRPTMELLTVPNTYTPISFKRTLCLSTIILSGIQAGRLNY